MQNKTILFYSCLLFLFSGNNIHSQTANHLFTGSNNEMLLVEGTDYVMGNSAGENRRLDERPVHNVVISDFFVSKYEITVNDYRRFCTKTGNDMPPEPKKGWGDNHPIANINWYDAITFCNWLSKENGLSPFYNIDTTKEDPNNLSTLDTQKWLVTYNHEANGFRLPFEAEWEYMARGGKKGNFLLFSEEEEMTEEHLSYIAWFKGNNEPFGTKAVGLKDPNELGVYDVFGNVSEWCNDWYNEDYYNISPKNNPQGPEQGENKVIRGGYFNSYPQSLYAYRRNSFTPDRYAVFIGFRVCRPKK